MPTRDVTPELHRQYLESGLWSGQALYRFLDAAADRSPEKLAVADPSHRLTYRAFATLTKQLAAHLLDVGIEPGDAVAIQAPNSVFLPLVHFAANRAQAMYVPMHEAWREREVHHLLSTSGARVLFVLEDNLAMINSLRGDLPSLEHVIPLTIGHGGLKALPARDVDLGEAEVRLAGVSATADAVRFTMISSGTTALPKISGWTDDGLHALLLHNYARRSRLSPDDVAVAIAPAATGATGYVFAVLAPLLVGATSVLHHPWDPDDAVRLIEAESATYAVAIPTQIIMMLESPALERCSLESLARMSNGGAPLPEARARQTEELLGCRVHTMYGTTDAGVPTMMDVGDPEDKRVTTVGRCVDGVDLRIVGPDGLTAPTGQPGEVVYRSADKVDGYFNNSDATAAAFEDDGWFHSGDLGILDADGFLRIVGRAKDMIIRGGQNIAPSEIEELLSRHRKVVSVAVVAIPDEVFGERACAFVIPTDPTDPLTFQEMIACLEEAKVAVFKRPERLEIVGDFPLSAGGKVQKAALTALITP